MLIGGTKERMGTRGARGRRSMGSVLRFIGYMGAICTILILRIKLSMKSSLMA